VEEVPLEHVPARHKVIPLWIAVEEIKQGCSLAEKLF
jgi:hypothetical protein